MAKFFDQFPLVLYNINQGNDQSSTYQLPVNVMLRVRIIVEKLNRIFHYYDYTVREDETPEILAEKYYGDPEAHWLIMMTNNITDPQYDWPLNSSSFTNFIISKYGSVENAQTTWKKWYKVYRVDDTNTGDIYHRKFEITSEQYDDVSLQSSPTIEDTVVLSGKTMNVYFPYKERISCYDWELEANEDRRSIKLIKKEYYTAVRAEFLSIVNSADGIRKSGQQNNIRTV